ncbi:glucosyltransferase [Rhodotorula toruloides]
MDGYSSASTSRRRAAPAFQPFPQDWNSVSESLLRARVQSRNPSHSHRPADTHSAYSHHSHGAGTDVRTATGTGWDSASESGLSVLSAFPLAVDERKARAARKAEAQERRRRDKERAVKAQEATDSPLRRWARWMLEQPTLARWAVLLSLAVVVLVKWWTGLGGYSAYHSLFLGIIARLTPSTARFVTLRPISTTASKAELRAWDAFMARLEEEGDLRNWMRATVVVGDVLVWVTAVLVYCKRNFGKAEREVKAKRKMLVAAMTILLQPALILIDNGHFQYNSLMLGLTLWAINCFQSGHDVLGAVAFMLSLGFKQMALYYAPAVFAYLLGKCFWLGGREGVALFINLALAVTITFLALFAPFLTSLSSFLQAIHRIFPFARGLFEDKVANAWCALNVVVKLRDLAPVSTLAKLALLATGLAVLPSVAGVVAVSWQLGQARTSSSTTVPPTVILLPHAFFLSAMSFFLFSFQVHEKSILLPLMPLTLLMGGREVGYGRLDWEWGVLVNNVAVFSMWPLLKRDGLAVQYLALTGVWNWAVGYNPLAMRASFVKYLSLLTYALIFLLHAVESLASPPAHLPDLFPVLNLTLSAGVFGLAWLWATKRLTQEAWALGGLGMGFGGAAGAKGERALPEKRNGRRHSSSAPMFRAAARTAFRQPRQAVSRSARRSYTTANPTGPTPQKSDLPWVIGSALVFIPAIVSLTSPPEILKHSSSHETKHENVPSATKATKAENPRDPTEESLSHEEKKEATPEAKEAAKLDQPKKQEKLQNAIAESKEEEETSKSE